MLVPSGLDLRFRKSIFEPLGLGRFSCRSNLVCGLARFAAQLFGLEWLPGPRPWPEPERAALLLLIAPLSEEAFFRAYLMTALERAGAPANAALLASAAGFALYHVPLAEMLRDGSLELAFYELLGLYLGFLYQRSGRSLPLAVVTHASFNSIVTALRAAQVDSVLPF